MKTRYFFDVVILYHWILFKIEKSSFLKKKLPKMTKFSILSLVSPGKAIFKTT